MNQVELNDGVSIKAQEGQVSRKRPDLRFEPAKTGHCESSVSSGDLQQELPVRKLDWGIPG